MRIVILGAGKIGSFVAQVLSQEEHDVTLIDREKKVLEQLGRESDIATIHAEGPSVHLFEELFERHPDLFFAATGDDATNLVSCALAKNIGYPKTVARVKKREHLHHPRLDFGRIFFVDSFIGAENLAAQDLFNEIVHAGDVTVGHFAHGAIQMRTFAIPQTWKQAHVPLSELSLPGELIVGLIRRKTSEGEQILFPHGDDHILPRDQVSIIGDAKIMHQIHETFHFAKKKVRSVILVGGTETAFHLAYLLSAEQISVRLIERDFSHCNRLADLLPNVTLINQDGRDPNLLQAERVQDASAFVSCTHHDGDNFLMASLAKQFGSPCSISLLSDAAAAPILEKMGVIPSLSARVSVANRLLSILHAGAILSIASLSCDATKVVELKVSASSPLVGIPLANLKHRFPKDFLIAVIESQGKVMVGKGSRILSPNDTVIAICHTHEISEISKLFS